MRHDFVTCDWCAARVWDHGNPARVAALPFHVVVWFVPTDSHATRPDKSSTARHAHVCGACLPRVVPPFRAEEAEIV